MNKPGSPFGIKPPGKKAPAPAAPSKDTNALWRIEGWRPSLTADQKSKLKLFHAELLKFNPKLNLISRNTEREADELHFMDCLMASEMILKLKLPKRIFDIGSGNGFPGIVFPIFDDQREYVLVESDARKCEFLKHIISALKLSKVTVANVRFETLSTVGIEVAISRGFAAISKSLLVSNKIFPKGGRFIHLKGPNWSSEIAALPSQLISVWEPELLGEYFLPATQQRRAIVVTHKKV